MSTPRSLQGTLRGLHGTGSPEATLHDTKTGAVRMSACPMAAISHFGVESARG